MPEIIEYHTVHGLSADMNKNQQPLGYDFNFNCNWVKFFHREELSLIS